MKLQNRHLLMSCLSHEIRTPVNAICLGIELLRRDLLLKNIIDTTTKEYLDDIDTSAELTIDTLNDMLNYEYIDMNVLEISKEKVIVVIMIRNILKQFRAQVNIILNYKIK